MDSAGFVDREAFAQALVDEGLSTDAETVLALCEAQQAAMASLMWEGWDVAVPGASWRRPGRIPKRRPGWGGMVSGRAMAGKDQVRRRMIEHGIPHRHSHVEAFFSAQRQVTLRLLREGYEIEHPIGRLSTTILPLDLPSGLYRLDVRTVLIPRDGLQRGALPDPILVVVRTA